MDSLNHDNQADVIEAFNSTSRYLDDLLNINNPYFEGVVNQIYPSELQLNKANISDTEAPFLDLHLSVANGFVSSKIYDKRDDFDFDIVNLPFLDGDVPRRASYGVYISQLIIIIFLFSFTSLSSFFTHIETDQSVGGAKTGVPGEKTPDTPASRTWLVPHVTRAPSEARTHIGEMIE